MGFIFLFFFIFILSSEPTGAQSAPPQADPTSAGAQPVGSQVLPTKESYNLKVRSGPTTWFNRITATIYSNIPGRVCLPSGGLFAGGLSGGLQPADSQVLERDAEERYLKWFAPGATGRAV